MTIEFVKQYGSHESEAGFDTAKMLAGIFVALRGKKKVNSQRTFTV